MKEFDGDHRCLDVYLHTLGERFPRHRYILEKMIWSNVTGTEMAHRLHVSQQRVHQIKRQALKALAALMCQSCRYIN